MNALAHDLAEARGIARSNLFLAATLSWGTEQSLAKIRNMAAHGALLELAVVPKPNSRVQLIRGEHVVQGRVVWSEGKRCGVHFESTVAVAEWLKPTSNLPQPHSCIRAPEPTVVPFPAPTARIPDVSAVKGANGPEQLAGDLKLVMQLIDELSEELAEDLGSPADLLIKFQNFDFSMQMLAAICEGLSGSASGSSDAFERRAHLRKSCLTALRVPPSRS